MACPADLCGGGIIEIGTGVSAMSNGKSFQSHLVSTEIVRPAPYGRMHVWCSKHQCRHPIDKPCDASIEAYRIEFEAEIKEKDRQRKKRERENPNKINKHVQDATIENIGESPEASAEAMKAR